MIRLDPGPARDRRRGGGGLTIASSCVRTIAAAFAASHPSPKGMPMSTIAELRAIAHLTLALDREIAAVAEPDNESGTTLITDHDRLLVEYLLARLVDHPIEPHGIVGRIEGHIANLMRFLHGAGAEPIDQAALDQWPWRFILAEMRSIANHGDQIATARHEFTRDFLVSLDQRITARLDAIEAKLGRFIEGVDRAADDIADTIMRSRHAGERSETPRRAERDDAEADQTPDPDTSGPADAANDAEKPKA